MRNRTLLTRDIKDEYTVLLMHFDESITYNENGINFTVKGTPTISTTNAKFGKAYKSTGSGNNITSDYVIPLGGQDFTIDFWYYFPSGIGDWKFMLRMAQENNTQNQIFVATRGNYLYITYPNNNNHFITSATNGQLRHVAITYQHSTAIWKTYINGVNMMNWTSSCQRGNFNVFIAGENNMTIDELRISDGILRWTSNFTPPTEPYES